MRDAGGLVIELIDPPPLDVRRRLPLSRGGIDKACLSFMPACSHLLAGALPAGWLASVLIMTNSARISQK